MHVHVRACACMLAAHDVRVFVQLVTLLVDLGLIIHYGIIISGTSPRTVHLMSNVNEDNPCGLHGEIN